MNNKKPFYTSRFIIEMSKCIKEMDGKMKTIIEGAYYRNGKKELIGPMKRNFNINFSHWFDQYDRSYTNFGKFYGYFEFDIMDLDVNNPLGADGESLYDEVNVNKHFRIKTIGDITRIDVLEQDKYKVYFGDKVLLINTSDDLVKIWKDYNEKVCFCSNKTIVEYLSDKQNEELKFCIDCKFHIHPVPKDVAYCINKECYELGLVSGKRMISSCHDARYVGNCGKEGKFYEKNA
jgi:hypothetical protein